jgi:hypothetical protein
MGIMKKIQALRYRIFKPKLKAEYQFGSPIIGLYAYEDKLIVYTALDIYITEDGVSYVRAKRV